jgi:hypothetical protein
MVKVRLQSLTLQTYALPQRLAIATVDDRTGRFQRGIEGTIDGDSWPTETARW